MILPTPNYNVELIAENGKHLYRVRSLDGSPVVDPIYPGVTGVLNVINKPALVPWAKKIALEKIRQALLKRLGEGDQLSLNEIYELIEESKNLPDQLKDAAAQLGTEAHAYIDKFVKGEPLGPLPDNISEPVSGFAEWWKRSGFRFIAGDTKVASRRHAFGGSLDALATKNRAFILLDWKTSKAIYNEYALQVAAYVKATEEMYPGIKIAEAWCVRFRKPGVTGPAFEALQVSDIERSFEAFLAAKSLQGLLKNEHFARPLKQEK